MSRARAVRRWAVIPAAGRGERMGGGDPKQYRTLLGRSVLEHALGPFLAHPGIQGVVVVLAAEDRTWPTLACARDTRLRTAEGGVERMVSVANGLTALEREATPEDWVLVHDAARPCLRAEDLDRLIAELDDDEVGGLLAIPIGDTVKRSDESNVRVAETLARGGLWAAQTPQMFRYGLMRRALAHCAERNVAVTDEATAIESLGLRPRLVAGSTRNLKVTREDDLRLAEAILREGVA
jgi:2-C-methyl-D-erythritol 4-phosphate cytidylyltransferase